MAIKKNELYSFLWASCDKLRGGMDASQYKDYILTLLFVKYVTDKFKGVKYADITVPEACPDHIHLFVEIPPKYSVSSFMGYLKGKSSTMLYEQFGELKYKYRNREFWCRGYYVDTVGKNESRIAEYVRNQLKEDELGEQLRIPSDSPFTGRK